MDANPGEPWSKTDIDDLKASLAFGNKRHRGHGEHAMQGRGRGRPQSWIGGTSASPLRHIREIVQLLTFVRSDSSAPLGASLCRLEEEV